MKEPEAFIYIIRSKISLNFYLGSTNDVKKRKSTHFRHLKRGIHHSPILQNAYKKYGESGLEFIIFQFCYQKEKLELEQYYLTLLKPRYNISKSSSAPMQGRKHSKKTINKMRNRHHIKGEKHHCYGTKWSQELREKIIKSRTGLKKTKETKLKMRETAIRLNRHKDLLPWIESNKKKVIDSNGNNFTSMKECAIFWDISIQTVCDILKGRHFKTRKGISFKYAY